MAFSLVLLFCKIHKTFQPINEIEVNTQFSCLTWEEKKCFFAEAFLILNVGARGVMVIVNGNVHGDQSSNPGRWCLHFM